MSDIDLYTLPSPSRRALAELLDRADADYRQALAAVRRAPTDEGANTAYGAAKQHVDHLEALLAAARRCSSPGAKTALAALLRMAPVSAGLSVSPRRSLRE
jgi:hypothetical protein